jgi:hypothetical protein
METKVVMKTSSVRSESHSLLTKIKKQFGRYEL